MSRTRTTPTQDWPAGVKTGIKALYAKVLSHAETAGHIGVGDDSDDLP